ncbi:hypothetical protein D3C86_1883480 [compost metagenome]
MPPCNALVLFLSCQTPVVGLPSGSRLLKLTNVESSLHAVDLVSVTPFGTTIIVIVAVSQFSELNLSQIL